MTKHYARDSDIIGNSEYKKFFKEVTAFFVKWAKCLQTSMPKKNDVIKSLIFLRLPERHQATLDELHVLMQRFPRVITDINALESEFLEYQATPDDEFPAYFYKDDKSKRIDILWQIYTLVNLVLNNLKFYFWFLTVIHIVRVYFYIVQAERSALMITIN